jgi:phosphohistidine phosphatase SixA
MKRLILSLALVAGFAGPAAAQTVILARHGEKADASADPLLSEAGVARSEALALAVARAGVTHVFSTPLQRTRLTGGPAAAAAGVDVRPVSLEGGGAAHIARMTETLKALGSDDVALVVGHSNTVPAIAEALGVAGVSAISDCEYDRLIVIDMDGGAVRAVTGRYGAPTAPC